MKQIFEKEKVVRNKENSIQQNISNAISHDDQTCLSLNSHYTLILVVLSMLLAIILRYIYFKEVNSDYFFKKLIIDAEAYDNLGRLIASGNWMGGKDVFYQSPLYGYFLALIYKLGGFHYSVVRTCQMIMDSACVIFMFLAGRLLWNNVVGIIAGFLWALYPISIYYTGLLEKTTFSQFFVCLSFYLTLKVLSKTTAIVCFGTGIILGLTCLTRGNFFLVVFLLLIFLSTIYIQTLPMHETVKKLFWISLGLFLPLAIVSARNYIVSKDIILLSPDGGLNFYIGNNKEAIGGTYNAPFFVKNTPDMEYESSKQAAEFLSKSKFDKASQVSSFWYSQGFDFIKNNSSLFLSILKDKIVLLLNGFEPPETYSIYYFKEKSKLLTALFRFNFGVLLSLSCVGIWLLRMKILKNHHIGLLLTFLVGYAVSVLIFYVTSRYRFPIVVPLILLGSYTLYAGVKHLAMKRYVNFLLIAIIATVLSIVFNRNTYTIKKALMPAALSLPYLQIGYDNLDSGNYLDAIASYETARNFNPQIAHIHYAIGTIYLKLNRYEDARKSLIEAIRLEPTNIEAYNNLGNVFFAEKKYKEAAGCFQKAVSGGLTSANSNCQHALERMNKRNEK